MNNWLRHLGTKLRRMSINSARSRRFHKMRGSSQQIEIDVLEARLLLTSDFGDAPDPLPGVGRGNYQTLAVRGGPAHVIATSQTQLFLGAGVDGESTGVQSSNANGDDRFLAGGRDDEDGVLSLLDLQSTVGASPRITLQATNTLSVPAMLYGWIDFNQNGVFENSTERALIAVPAATFAGRFTLTFPTTPAGSVGATYARFRLSTDFAAANPLGTAQDGEVEDYPFTIQNRLSLPPLITHAVELGEGLQLGTANSASNFFGVDVASIGDLNNDGVSDIVATDIMNGGDFEGGMPGAVHVIFLNADGSVKSSTKIASGINGGPALDPDEQFGSSITSLGDIDGDGIVDIAVGADGSGSNSEEGSEGAIYVLNLNTDGSVRRFTKIASGVNGGPLLGNTDSFGTAMASIGDLDGDGLAELAVGAPNTPAGGVERGVIHVLYLNADGTVRRSTQIDNEHSWSTASLDESALGARFAAIGDLDGNGVIDLAALMSRRVSDDPEDLSLPAAIYVLLLNPDGTGKAATTTVDGMNSGPTLGNADLLWDVAAVGDLDADGVRDLAVVTQDMHNDPTTAITFVMLNPDGSIKGYRILPIDTTAEPLFTSLNSVGDTNGDGRMELALGQPFNGGFSEPDGIVQVFTLEKPAAHTAAPATPVIDRSLALSRSRRPTIQWSEISNATSYELWIKDIDTGAVLVNSVNVHTNSYTPATDLPMHRLAISIRAKNEAGKSNWTSSYNLTIARIVITNPVATGMNRRPTLTWESLPEAVRYEVWVNAAATPRTATIRTVTVDTATSFTPPANLRSGIYQFQVRGVRADGGLDIWSEAKTFEVKTKVSAVTVRKQFTLTPRLSWSELAEAASYDIWINGRNSTSTRQVRLTSSAASPSLVIPSLKKGEYSVWVRGVAADGTLGDWSSPVNFSFGKAPAFLETPTELPMGSQVTLRWQLTDSAHHYELWIDDPAEGLTPISSILTVHANSYVYSSLSRHGNYRFWVRAVADDGTVGVWSSTLYVASRNTITGVTITARNPARPEIRWTAMPDALRYRVTIDGLTYPGGDSQPFVPPQNLSEGIYTITVTGIADAGVASFPSEVIRYQVFRAPILLPVESTPDPTVTLRWDDDSDSPVTRIRVVMPEIDYAVLDITRTDAAGLHSLRLLDGNYRWMVFSRNANAWSAPADFTIDRSATMTSSLTQSTRAPVELTWLAVSGADRYEVWIMDDRGLTTYRNSSVEGTRLVAPVQLAEGRTYRTWVRAISSSNSTGSWSIMRLLRVTDIS